LMHKVGLDICVMTDGAQGQHLWRPQHGWESLPASTVSSVLDATGAGDSFLAGLLAGLRRGLNATAACALGSQTAARCVQTLGAWPQR
jgi:sugar/nucleoside kinase (ribokinase family)